MEGRNKCLYKAHFEKYLLVHSYHSSINVFSSSGSLQTLGSWYIQSYIKKVKILYLKIQMLKFQYSLNVTLFQLRMLRMTYPE